MYVHYVAGQHLREPNYPPHCLVINVREKTNTFALLVTCGVRVNANHLLMVLERLVDA